MNSTQKSNLTQTHSGFDDFFDSGSISQPSSTTAFDDAFGPITSSENNV